jgi:hypothetical protein
VSRKVALATGASTVGVALGALGVEGDGDAAERRVEGCGTPGSRGTFGDSEAIGGETVGLGAARALDGALGEALGDVARVPPSSVAPAGATFSPDKANPAAAVSTSRPPAMAVRTTFRRARVRLDATMAFAGTDVRRPSSPPGG